MINNLKHYKNFGPIKVWKIGRVYMASCDYEHGAIMMTGHTEEIAIEKIENFKKECKAMEELQNELLKLGDILVLKNDFVFTLLMRITDNSARNIFKITETVTNHITGKENIEVMKNDDEYVLIVLKP